ncbi:hypothetical protein Btru_018683 [Bulinus truncatus]|nr:hypothetical protein Btru_018683 [Bulinus truncatus]
MTYSIPVYISNVCHGIAVRQRIDGLSGKGALGPSASVCVGCGVHGVAPSHGGRPGDALGFANLVINAGPWSFHPPLKGLICRLIKSVSISSHSCGCRTTTSSIHIHVCTDHGGTTGVLVQGNQVLDAGHQKQKLDVLLFQSLEHDRWRDICLSIILSFYLCPSITKSMYSPGAATEGKFRHKYQEFQAQISEFQAQISEIQAQISEFQAQISEIQAQISEFWAQISEIRAINIRVSGTNIRDSGTISEICKHKYQSNMTCHVKGAKDNLEPGWGGEGRDEMRVVSTITSMGGIDYALQWHEEISGISLCPGVNASMPVVKSASVGFVDFIRVSRLKAE